MTDWALTQAAASGALDLAPTMPLADVLLANAHDEHVARIAIYYAVDVPTLESVITCPLCGKSATEAMPVNACQHFYRCTGCGETLKPLEGDCCVFCSYRDRACPPQQVSGQASS